MVNGSAWLTSSLYISISNLRMNKVRTTHVRYFTGGLISIPVEGGSYVLGPVEQSSEAFSYYGPYSFPEACLYASQAGCYYVGANEIAESTSPERSEFWYPNIGNGSAVDQSSDGWAGVAFQARQAGDERASNVARYLSISLSSASRRMRDVAKLLNEQLGWAILSKKKSGVRFSNVAVHDLYLAIHSLLAEMCSARDYLSLMAARRVHAKEGTDSLARLIEWLKKPSSNSARSDPLVQLLLSASYDGDQPGWLTKLTELRNQIAHRQPLGADPAAAALLFERVATSGSLLPRIRLARFSGGGEKIEDGEDPFVALLRYWLELESLSQASLAWSTHGRGHPHFVAEKRGL